MLPEGKDPADIILENPVILSDSIKNAKHIIDLELTRAKKNFIVDSREQKMYIEKNILPLVAVLKSPAEKAHFISEISFLSRMSEMVLWEIIKTLPTQSEIRNQAFLPQKINDSFFHQGNKDGQKLQMNRKTTIARKLFGIAYWLEKGTHENIKDLDIRLKMSKMIGEHTVLLLEEGLPKDELIFEAESSYGPEVAIDQLALELIVYLQQELLREQYEISMRKLQQAERDKDQEAASTLLQKCQDISLLQKLIKEKEVSIEDVLDSNKSTEL
jgi:hypothetical protein